MFFGLTPAELVEAGFDKLSRHTSQFFTRSRQTPP